jgi:ABC-type sugar transport system, periplasmic component
MKFHKVLSLLLVITMVSITIISCGDTSNQSVVEDTTTAASNGEDIADTETTVPKIELPTMDYEGHSFAVLAREDGTGSTTWDIRDICAKEQTGELINDAVYNRNIVIEEKYNITIDEIKIDGGQINNTVSNVVMAGDATYDTVMQTVESTCAMMLAGTIMDLTDAPHLDFSQPWWDANIMGDVSFNGRTFFATGDICLNDDKSTWGVVFNKKLAEDYGIPNMYDLVKDGNWTIDKLYEYASSVYEDINGDGVMSLQEDLWGIYDQLECAPAFYTASGLQAISKDDSNNITYNLDSEKTYNAFEKIYNFMTDQTFQFIAEKHTVTDIWATMRAHYRNDQALFFMCIFGALPQFRSMETDFGLLPTPKIFDDQESYYSAMQYNNGTVYAIPKSAGDFERSCIILESMAMGSPETLTVAFYDMTLQEKALRDQESVEMMKFILDNRLFDFTMAFGSIGMLEFFKSQVQTAANNFASSEAAKKDAFLLAVDKIIETVNDLD